MKQEEVIELAKEIIGEIKKYRPDFKFARVIPKGDTWLILIILKRLYLGRIIREIVQEFRDNNPEVEVEFAGGFHRGESGIIIK